MKAKYRGYYEFLKEEINRFRGDFDDFILYMPEFFRLLSNLLNEDIDQQDRRYINCALAYFVVPSDVIPEEIYGPFGYIDDIFLCCYVLNMLQEKYGFSYLESCWECDEPLETVLDYSLKESSDIIEEKGLRDDILAFVGLEE